MLGLVRDPFHPRVIAVARKKNKKNNGHSAKSAGSRLNLNTRTPLTHRSRSGLIMLSRRSVGTYQ